MRGSPIAATSECCEQGVDERLLRCELRLQGRPSGQVPSGVDRQASELFDARHAAVGIVGGAVPVPSPLSTVCSMRMPFEKCCELVTPSLSARTRQE